MPTHDTHAPTMDGTINDLYWNSSRTIAEILAESGIARSTLYASVTPMPIDIACPTCRGTLVFTNRMNRAAGMSTCDDCGLTTQMESREGDTDTPASNGHARGTATDANSSGRRPLGISGSDWDRIAAIGGVAALGVMIGAAATHAVRR